VALRPEDQQRVNDLTETAAFLRANGKEGWADTVDFIRTPEGIKFVNRLRVDRLRRETEEGKYGQNLAIAMPLVVREEIKTSVAQAQRENLAEELRRNVDPEERTTITVSSEAGKALQAFVDGEFVPVRPVRAARGSAEKTANLNVRVDADLRQRAEDFGADNAAKFGWAPRASHIITAWLVQKFTGTGAKAAK